MSSLFTWWHSTLFLTINVSFIHTWLIVLTTTPHCIFSYCAPYAFVTINYLFILPSACLFRSFCHSFTARSWHNIQHGLGSLAFILMYQVCLTQCLSYKRINNDKHVCVSVYVYLPFPLILVCTLTKSGSILILFYKLHNLIEITMNKKRMQTIGGEGCINALNVLASIWMSSARL